MSQINFIRSLYFIYQLFSLDNQKYRFVTTNAARIPKNMTTVLKTKHYLNGGIDVSPVVAKKAKFIVRDLNGNHLKEEGILRNGECKKLTNGVASSKKRSTPSRECGQLDMKDILERRHANVG